MNKYTAAQQKKILFIRATCGIKSLTEAIRVYEIGLYSNLAQEN